MKRLLTILFIMLVSVAFAQTVGTTIKLQKPNNDFIFAKSDDNGHLKIVSEGPVVTEYQDQTLSLSANVIATITSEITGTRDFIVISSTDSTKTFWISLNGTAVINSSYPVRGSIYIEAPKNKSISIISDSAISVYVMEGGY